MALAATAFISCARFEEDDLFDESAALRVEHNAEKVADILTSAPQGWVMQYHTGTGIAVFEGFNIFARFDKSGKVTLASDHRYLRDGNAGNYTEASSLYELIREEGLVLAFNTWNDVLTPFVDPVSYSAAPDNLVKDGAGMAGDQNLVVTFISDDELIFRGERYSAEVRMVKADRDWKTYISDTKTMKERFTNSTINTYYLVSGTDTLYAVGLRDGRYRISDRVSNPLHSDSVSCCFTPNGFRNERKYTFSEHSFQELKMNDEGSALVSEDGTVSLMATWDTYIAGRTATWDIRKESLPEELQAIYSQIETELQKLNKQWSLKSLGLGRSTGKNAVTGLILTYYTTTARSASKTNNAGLQMNMSRTQYGQMAMSCPEGSSVDNNLSVFTTRGTAVESLMRQFAAAISDTYVMTPNNYFLPTSVLYTHTTSGIDFWLDK